MADALTPQLRLETTYDPSFGRSGGFELVLVNTTGLLVTAARMAVTSIVPMRAPSGSPVEIRERVSVYHEIAIGAPISVDAGGSSTVARVWCEFPPFHANDGPASAFLIHDDGTTTPLRVAPMTRLPGTPCSAADVAAALAAPAADVHLEARPHDARPSTPAAVTANGADPGRVARPLALGDAGDLAVEVWAQMARAERSVHGSHDQVLGPAHGDADRVEVRVDSALGPDRFRIADLAAARAGGGPVEVAAGGAAGLRRAFSAIARLRRGEHPPLGPARHDWRGFHIDLARQWYPAATVTELIEIAGWYGLDRVHLHLTDDEAWRVPIAAHPALTDVGAWRGYGRPIPPLLGTGAERTGGSYTPAEIGAWVVTAAGLGIELIPEVDLPGHSFAALAALPALRDPEDVSGAVSVQGFVDNVLNPGVAATMPFLEQVLGEVADLFPGRWLHLGGDEVPAGAWLGSPAARRFAAARGVEGTRGIEAAFMRDVIRLVTVGLGRRVGVWQEAAECGALQPGEGYAIGWLSNAANRELAAAGHDVVAAPAQAYYLDMADRADWEAPGAFWAGVITPATIGSFDPSAGWSAAERAHLLGVQACLWSEHVHDEAVLRHLLLPRLGVFADRAWSPA